MSSGNGGFPGLAVFSLLGVSLVLAVVGLASTQPWATESLAPRVSIAPGLGDEAAVGDALVVVRPRPNRLVRAAVSGAQRATLVSEPAGKPGGLAAEGLGVARARPLTGNAPSSNPPSSPQPQPSPSPDPAPAAELVPVQAPPAQPGPGPILAGVEGEDSPEPGTAVVDEFGPLEVCEGDDYALALLLYIETVAGGEVGETLAMHFEGGESEGTVYLEGASVGVVELVDLLLAEGECLTITVEIASRPEGTPSLPAAEPSLPPSPTP